MHLTWIGFGANYVLVLDNARVHHKYEDMIRMMIEGVNPNARLEFLPPYTPELNPVRIQCSIVHCLLGS